MSKGKPRYGAPTRAEIEAKEAAAVQSHERAETNAAETANTLAREARECRKRLRRALEDACAEVSFPFKGDPDALDQKGARELQLARDLGVHVRSIREYLRDVSKLDECPQLPGEKLVRAIQRLTKVRTEYILRGEMPELTTEVATGDWSADLCTWLLSELDDIPAAQRLRDIAGARAMDADHLKKFIVAAVREGQARDDELRAEFAFTADLVGMVSLLMPGDDTNDPEELKRHATELLSRAQRFGRERIRARLFDLFMPVVGNLPDGEEWKRHQPLPRFRIRDVE